jgi:hypothetical protein
MCSFADLVQLEVSGFAGLSIMAASCSATPLNGGAAARFE